MSESIMYSFDLLDEIERVSDAAITLSPAQMRQAAELSRGLPDGEQWQTYLNALALISFEEWLRRRAREVVLNRADCSLLHPSYAGTIPAVCNLNANQFRLCLIATGDLTDTVSVPRAVIELPEFVAHFYVAVEIREEQQQGIVQGFLRHDQLLAYQQSHPLSPEADQTYSLPYDWFEQDPDRLLLHLRCLEPDAIPLPEITRDRATTLSNLFQFLTQRAVNTGLWLREQWDEVAQEVAWVLLPPTTTSMMRSPVQSSFQRSPGEEFAAIVQQLERSGLRLPAQARGAYRDWIMANIPLRLYAIVGEVPPTDQQPEWSLLLVLGAQPRTSLPQGISLQVSDPTGILVERTLDSQTTADYLFVQVSGTWDEKFLASITLPDGERLTLPPFGFQPTRGGEWEE